MKNLNFPQLWFLVEHDNLAIVYPNGLVERYYEYPDVGWSDSIYFSRATTLQAIANLPLSAEFAGYIR